MKKCIPFSLFLLLWTVSLHGQNAAMPNWEGWVNDYANVISEEVEANIAAIAEEVRLKTGAEIAVVTVPNLQGLALEDYATRLYEKWGIGQKGKDNGVMLLLAMEERKIRIETGYGLEGILPDGLCGEIRDQYIEPDLRRGEYGNGLYRGVLAIAGVIAKDAGVQISGAIEPQYPVRGSRESSKGGLVLLLLFILLVVLTRGRIVPWL
ncbi:MAG TPA: TPM domain-containing protein, partial [bacterium]